MHLVIALLAFNLNFAHADKIGEVNSTAAPSSAAKASAVNDSEGSGEELAEVASAGGAVRAKPGNSWRNTQLVLKGMNKVRCRMGGPSARVAAVEALKSEGFCDISKDRARVRNFTKLPAGTVWVYNHKPFGNSVVKTSNGSFYGSRKLSSPPADRGNLIAVMQPGCGDKAPKCTAFKYVKKDQSRFTSADEDEVKNSSGESPNADDSEISSARQKAEGECGYKLAGEDLEAFNECVSSKMPN